MQVCGCCRPNGEILEKNKNKLSMDSIDPQNHPKWKGPLQG